MSDTGHDLASEFPELKERIHELKVANAHFRKLSDEYHDLNKQIHRAEQRIDVLPELEEEKLRKRRLQLKDELYAMLKAQH